MKKILSIVLLIVFTGQLTGNYWIMAAFYLNRDYIAANLCVNRFDLMPVCKGSCYLEKRLDEHTGKQQRSPDLRSGEIALFHPVYGATVAPDWIVRPDTNYPIGNTPSLLKVIPVSVFRPPCAFS